MKVRTIGWLIVILALHVTYLSASDTYDDDWVAKVPPAEHGQKNPIRTKSAVIIQGRSVFRAHCAQCHGEDAKGSDRAPTLHSSRIKNHITDGDLHWLLVNGDKDRGMPSWAKLGDLQLWQVITYLRSLR